MQQKTEIGGRGHLHKMAVPQQPLTKGHSHETRRKIYCAVLRRTERSARPSTWDTGPSLVPAGEPCAAQGRSPKADCRSKAIKKHLANSDRNGNTRLGSSRGREDAAIQALKRWALSQTLVDKNSAGLDIGCPLTFLGRRRISIGRFCSLIGRKPKRPNSTKLPQPCGWQPLAPLRYSAGSNTQKVSQRFCGTFAFNCILSFHMCTKFSTLNNNKGSQLNCLDGLIRL